MSALTNPYIFALALFATLYYLLARPPRGLSPVEYRTWYRSAYLNGFYWRTFRRFRRWVGFGVCAHWWRGRCQGALHVHHRAWAYRWLYYEWLIWPFGTMLLCERHHKRIHAK